MIRLARLALATAFIASLSMTLGPSPANAQSCIPRTASTYRYTSTSFRFVFVIHVCDDRPTISVAIQIDRKDSIGDFGLAIYGNPPCSNRVCWTAPGFSHAKEIARYDGSITWADLATDAEGPIFCVTTASTSGCRPPP